MKCVRVKKGSRCMQEKLFLYYTSDLHSHFENWPKIVAFLNEKKMERQREGQSFFLLDNGDHIDRVHPISEALLGKGNVTLLNRAAYDVVTIGNNEGITLDHDSLYHLYDDASFFVVCANLHNRIGNNPSWLKATTSVKSISGIKVGIIGLTAPFQAFYDPLDWTIEDPFQALDRELRLLADQSDIIVLLSHLGLNEDERIADQYPMIDVIIGGHSHHLFRHGELINASILTAVGKYGHHVGEIVLTWDHDMHQLVKKEAYATNIDHYPMDAQTERLVATQGIKSEALLNQPIANLTFPLEVDWYKKTNIIEQLTDTLRNWTNADIAMLNAGILLDSLDEGPVTYQDIHRICPHPINPCVITLTGQALLEVIRGVVKKSFMELEVQGFGFRGKVIGRMIFSGIVVNTVIDNDGMEHVASVDFQSEPLDLQKRYRLATADMFTFGQLSPAIARSKSKEFFMPEFIRDLLVQTLMKQYQ